jgi:hypothetical protein
MSASFQRMPWKSPIGRPNCRVAQGQLVGALGQPERHRGRAQPLAVVGAHQVLEAVGRAHQHLVLGDPAAVEVEPPLRDAAQPHGVVALADAEAGRVALDEDPADARGAGRAAHAAVDQVEA